MSIASLSGRTVVVTGGSDGIGRAAVRAVAAAGADVVMVGRNEAKTRAAAQAIMSEVGRRCVSWEIADLSRLDGMYALASRLHAALPRVDVLVNNAGACFLDRGVTVDGLERTYALNHLHYFVLTLLLLEPLARASTDAAAPARVICVSSRAHRDARLDMNDLQLEQGFAGWRAYANSKLCNLLFVREFARRVDPNRLVVHAVHPGVVATRFGVQQNGRRGRLLRRLMDLRAISPTEGADTIAWLAQAEEARQSTGAYWVKRRHGAMSRAARDERLSRDLWTMSATQAAIDPDRLITSSGLVRP